MKTLDFNFQVGRKPLRLLGCSPLPSCDQYEFREITMAAVGRRDPWGESGIQWAKEEAMAQCTRHRKDAVVWTNVTEMQRAKTRLDKDAL